MRINFRVSNADIPDLLKRYVDKRLRFALSRFGPSVGDISVTVHGIAGRAGESKCHITMKVLPFGEITIQESGPDLFAAIDRATGRLGRRFGDELERIQQMRRGRESIRITA